VWSPIGRRASKGERAWRVGRGVRARPHLADDLDDAVLHLVERRRVVLQQPVDVPLIAAALDAGAGQQVSSTQHLPQIGLPGELLRVQRFAELLLIHLGQIAAKDARRGRGVIDQLEDALLHWGHDGLQTGELDLLIAGGQCIRHASVSGERERPEVVQGAFIDVADR